MQVRQGMEETPIPHSNLHTPWMDLQIIGQFLIPFHGTLSDDALGFLLIFGVPGSFRAAPRLCCRIGTEQRGRDCAENPAGKSQRP